VLVLLVTGLAAGVAVRLVELQVVRRDAFQARADDQHQGLLSIPATRGAIVDRNGEPLALAIESRSLYAHPRRVDDPDRSAALLASVLDRPRSDLAARLRSNRSFVYLGRLLEPETADAVLGLGLPLGAGAPFGFEHEPKRVYPHAQLAAHVVGFATVDGDGVEGIELAYDEALEGDPTVYLVLQDARDGRLRELVRPPQKRPLDVVLTIDTVLQYLVERELDAALRATRSRAGFAVLLDPRTGDVLALANRPTPDLNAFGRADDRARLNRAVVGMFEPGSTFKVVPLAAALDRGRVDPNRAIDCENGVYRSGRRVIHDVSPHRLLTPEEILEKSSNIGMVKIANTLSRAELYDAITGFGFGSRTGIELPGESPGAVQRPERWSDFTHASLAFGQEIGVTGLQLASAFGALAHDGLRVPPRLVVGTRDADGHVHRAPRPAPERVVSARTSRQIVRMLENVVENGTGRRARVPGYRVAGKSGTAQKALPQGGYSPDDYVASFVAFAPVRSPRLVALVVLDSPRGTEHQGGQVAAPVAGRILADALPYLRVPQDPDAAEPIAPDAARLAAHETGPEPREGEETGIESAAPAAHDRLYGPDAAPDVTGLGLRDAVALLARHGCRVQVSGAGHVVAQVPEPGAPLAGIDVCTLRLDGRIRG